MTHTRKAIVFLAVAIVVALLIGCSGKTSGESSGALSSGGSQSAVDASSSTGTGSGGASSTGSSGSVGSSGTSSTGSGGSGSVGSSGTSSTGSASSGTGGSSGGTTIFCGLQTCGPDTKCCPGTGKCYDPKTQGCTGIGCAVAKCAGPNCPDSAPRDPGACCTQLGLTYCSSNSSCYYPQCQNCCPPNVQCNQQSDCPTGFSCCYNTRRCYNPGITSCGGPPAMCAADGSCPGNLTCCKLHNLCCAPGDANCCPTSCVPQSASCSGKLPCCGNLSCCGPPVVIVDAASTPGSCEQSCPISDRNAKHDITPIDPDQILERIASMPISEWSYNDQEPTARHIGPMAQDFHSAFDVGSSDRCIPSVDENGVALAAIQALYQRVQRLDVESRTLRQQNDALKREVDRLRKAPPK